MSNTCYKVNEKEPFKFPEPENIKEVDNIIDCGANGTFNKDFDLCICEKGWNGDLCENYGEINTLRTQFDTPRTVTQEGNNVVEIQKDILALMIFILFLINMCICCC